MSEIYEEMDDLLGKSLAKEATEAEALRVQNWLKESPDHAAYFIDFQWVWSQMQLAKPQKPVDTEGALANLHARMDALSDTYSEARTDTPPQGMAVVKTPAKIFNIYTLMKIAAVVFLGFATFNYLNRPADVPKMLAAVDKPVTDTLVDGSIITLNKKSGLVLADRFNKNERRMTLTGEAYFEVAHDATRPFVVEVQNVEVKAVGTAFNIDNGTDARLVSITVTDGKIKITGRDKSAFAEKGETATYDTETGVIRVEKRANPNVLAYKTRQFHFDETPLSIAVAEISKAFDVSITLQDAELGRCPVVVSFENKPLEEILDVLKSSCAFYVHKVGEGFILNREKTRNE